LALASLTGGDRSIGIVHSRTKNHGVLYIKHKRNAYRILVRKPEGKRPLARPRRRWVDNIKMDLREIGWDGVDSMDMARDRDQRRAQLRE
jgi:hypothetical protein